MGELANKAGESEVIPKTPPAPLTKRPEGLLAGVTSGSLRAWDKRSENAGVRAGGTEQNLNLEAENKRHVGRGLQEGSVWELAAGFLGTSQPALIYPPEFFPSLPTSPLVTTMPIAPCLALSKMLLTLRCSGVSLQISGAPQALRGRTPHAPINH